MSSHTTAPAPGHVLETGSPHGGKGALSKSALAGIGASAVPWATSSAFHVGILCVLAMGLHEHARQPHPAAMESSFAEAPPVAEFEASLFLDAPAGGNLATRRLGTASVDPLRLFEDPVLAADFDLSAAVAGSSAGTADGPGGEADGDGSGSGDGRVAFFGTEATGQRFVFLIDCSTSMRGDRFARARRELVRTLLHLTEEQEFYVIFFSDRTFPLYAPHAADGPVKGTKLHKARSRRWIANRVVIGGTVPDEGLRMALAMQPDVIYMLSDGDFDPSAREAARRANTHGTVIHTIGFGYKAGEAQLRGIAEDHGGRYRFVP